MVPAQRSRFLWKFILSIIPDLLVISILFIPSILSPWITPFERDIDLENPGISLAYQSTELFPAWTLPLITFILPCSLIFSIYLGEGRKRPALLLSVLGLLLAVSLTATLTDIIKNMAGRLRPDFLARCIPEQLSSGKVVCQQTRKFLVREGRRSFPSGHASSSFAGLGFAGLYLAGQMRVFNGEGSVWRMGLAVSPVIFALIVSFSRIVDHRHHVGDVLVGIILGTIVAVIIYRMYFPSVFSPNSERVYVKRIEKIKAEMAAEEEEEGCDAV